MLPDRPLAGIDDLVGVVSAVLLGVGLLQHADANLDEGLTRFRGVVSLRPWEFPRRSDRAALTADDDVGAAVDEVTHRRVGRGEPRAVVLMAVELKAADHARPIESRGSIETVLR